MIHSPEESDRTKIFEPCLSIGRNLNRPKKNPNSYTVKKIKHFQSQKNVTITQLSIFIAYI